MVQGTNFLFRDAKNRSAIQNDKNNALFLNGIFCFEKLLYAHHPAGSRT
ncbi:hypothetical protein BSLA_01r1683 [Burkholderia stabilis]|nr:hypothetical protein BSLA_01r1683 [Burkholderia stabilis]